MNGFIGAFGVNAAEFTHQQAGDDCGDRIGDLIGQHQRHHQYQAKNRMGRLAVRGRRVALLNGHVEHHKITPFLPELANQLPVTDDEKNIAQQDRLIHHRPFHRYAIALQPHDVQTVAGAEPHLPHGFTQQFRLRDQRHLGHADIQRLIGEILPAQHHRLQQLFAAKLAQVHIRGGHINQQDITRAEFRHPVDVDDHPAKPSPALYADHIRAIALTQLQVIQPLPHHRRAGPDRQTARAPGKAVLLNQIAEGASLPSFFIFVLFFTFQGKTGQQHVDHAHDQNDQPKRGDAEKAKALKSFPDQFAVDHQVRRRCHQGHHAADKPGKAQGHHQARRRALHPHGDAQHHRDKDSDHARGAHKRPQPGDGHHQVDQHLGFAAARHFYQPRPHNGRYAGAHQTIPDDKQGGNQDNVGIAKSGERFRQRQRSAEHKCDDNKQGDGVHAYLARGKKNDGD